MYDCLYLFNRAQLVLVASPLKTGFSTTVHGTITVIQHNVVLDGIRENNTRRKQVLQYKALDTGVVCTSSGKGL